MNYFYQHCDIYTQYKYEIKQFIISNPIQYILTDGINTGDNNCENFS